MKKAKPSSRSRGRSRLPVRVVDKLVDIGNLTRALWEVGVADDASDGPHARAVRAGSRIEVIDLLVTLGEGALIPLLACSPWGQDATVQRVVRDAARSVTGDDSWIVCVRCGNLLGSAVGYRCDLGSTCGAGIVCPLCGREARFAAADGDAEPCEHFLAYRHTDRSWWPLRSDVPPAPARRGAADVSRSPAEVRRALGAVAPLLGDVEPKECLAMARAWLLGDGQFGWDPPILSRMFELVGRPAGVVALDFDPAGDGEDQGAGVFYFAASGGERDRVAARVRTKLAQLIERLGALAARDPGGP